MRWGRFAAVVIAGALVGAVVAAQPDAHANPPGMTLTISGPTRVTPGTAASYRGVLSESVLVLSHGIQGATVNVLVDNVVKASATTAADGSYSVSLKLAVGTHSVRAAAQRGTPVEADSPSLTVEVPFRWSDVSASDPGTGYHLSDVSCVSTTFCVGVGQTYTVNNSNSTTETTLAETWDGSQWTVTPTPSPGPSYNVLSSVSCLSTTFCLAAGADDAVPGSLVERWDGSNWSLVPTPKILNGEVLSGISCTSTRSCIAVGQSYDFSGHWSTLAEQWDGSSWSAMSTPSPGTNNALRAVSCVSATYCVAAGSQNASILAEQFNGSVWSTMATVDPGGQSDLFGVSCSSQSACMITGYGGPPPSGLAEQWNGTLWTITPTPGNHLQGVSCLSASYCVAGAQNGYPYRTLAMYWDGANWYPTSTVHADYNNAFHGVSCLSPTFCLGAGEQYTTVRTPSGSWQTLAEIHGATQSQTQ